MGIRSFRAVRLVLGNGAPDGNEQIGESRARLRRRLSAPDRIVSLALGASFGAVAAAATAIDTERSVRPLLALVLVLAYAVMASVEFEAGTGSAIPTQLVFVPMLFLLPLGLVPACVAVGLLLSGVFEQATRAVHPERALVVIGGAWYSLGPVLVLALAGERAPSWHDWPLYVLALAAQFAIDFAISAGRGRFVLGVPIGAQLPAIAWTWVVDLGLSPIAVAAAIAAQGAPYAFLVAIPLAVVLAVFARERRIRIDQTLELSNAYRGTALLLGDVIESDDEYTGAHSRDVVQLVMAVVDRLKVDQRERRYAEFVALLHDVGKIRLPAKVIRKPGPLTRHERGLVEQHTLDGERMLQAVGGILGEVGRIVRSCHERYDGTGYPDGLAGDEIPLIARIVCACDAFSAMTTDRPYRRALTPGAAVAELRANAGSQFDPRIVAFLLETVQNGRAPSAAPLLPALATA